MPKWIVRPYGSASGSGLPSGQERRRLVDRGVVRAGQVGGAAPQLGDDRAERLQHLAGRGTGGDGLAGLEDRERAPPSPSGSSPARDPVELGGALRVGGAPLGERLLPRRPGLDGRGRAPARVCARTSSATSKVFSGSKPRTRLVAATSSSPSAEPCAASVFCAFGAGQAMIERIAMNEGRSVSALRGLRAPRTAPAGSRSPLGSGSTRWTCQPYASYRLRVSSENAVSVSPSMEMWLSSHSRTRLPSFWWPASEDASAEMPSCRSAVTGDRPDGVVERGGCPGPPRGRTGRARSGRPSPCPPRWRRPGRAGRSSSRRPAVCPYSGWPGVLRAPGAERLQVVQLQAVTGEVELDVEGQATSGPRRGRTGRGRSSPGRRGRAASASGREVRGRRQAHGRTGVAVADLLYGIHGQDADGVDGPLVQFGPLEVCGGRLGAHPGSGLLSTCRMSGDRALTGRCRAYPRANAALSGFRAQSTAPGWHEAGQPVIPAGSARVPRAAVPCVHRLSCRTAAVRPPDGRQFTVTRPGRERRQHDPTPAKAAYWATSKVAWYAQALPGLHRRCLLGFSVAVRGVRDGRRIPSCGGARPQHRGATGRSGPGSRRSWR